MLVPHPGFGRDDAALCSPWLTRVMVMQAGDRACVTLNRAETPGAYLLVSFWFTRIAANLSSSISAFLTN